MAFVLIQHLDPEHRKHDGRTSCGPRGDLQVVQVADGTAGSARPRLISIPPGTYLAIAAGTLRLSKPLERHGARMPFDFFLRSLPRTAASAPSVRSLSGTGTDGSLGLKAVKEKGGLVIVQDPEEAATSRQRQILDLVLAGHPSKNIAADLGISQRTVDEPSCGNHEEDRLEVAPGPDPHSDCCRLSHQEPLGAAGAASWLMTSK